MLFAPTLADKAILPRAWGGRYFFNRIGRELPLVNDSYLSSADAPCSDKGRVDSDLANAEDAYAPGSSWSRLSHGRANRVRQAST